MNRWAELLSIPRDSAISVKVRTNYVIAFPQAVNDGLGGKKFVYRFFTSLIPDLIEPAVNNCVGICGHNSA
jgi:hypothetical protein